MDSVLMVKIRFQNIHKNFPGDVTISPVFKKIAGWILLNMAPVQQKRCPCLCKEDTTRKVDGKLVNRLRVPNKYTHIGQNELQPVRSIYAISLTWNTCHYENMPILTYRKFYHQKLKIFRKKKSDIFHISAQNIDCGYSLEPPRRGGSNEYSQSMFLSRNKKNMYTPVNPSFTI